MGMTEQEAINEFKERLAIPDYKKSIPKYYEAMEMAVKALEKQIEKKPIRNDKCTCPSCGTHNEVIKKRRNTVEHDIVYCWHCGQALEVDWGNEDAE